MKKITTLDYIILGLLQQEPLTGYRIRKTFEDTALGSFGGSPGTIYPALKRLEKNKLISKHHVEESTKSNFFITDFGLKQLRLWLEAMPTGSEVRKNMELLVLKFAFMDPMISSDQKTDYLKALKHELEEYLKELENYFHNEKNNMPQTGMIAFEHGLLSYRASLQWCIRAKEHLIENNTDG